MYTTETLTKIFKEEGKDLFDARSASLGHTLQGGVPSPLDRTRAARLSLRCMQFLEEHACPNSQATHHKPKPAHLTHGSAKFSVKDTAAMIAIIGSKVVYASMEDVLKVTDMKLRRGTDEWWSDCKQLAETMGGRTGLMAKH